MNFTGPVTEIAQHIHKEKYRGQFESWPEFTYRVANGLKDNDEHYKHLLDIIGNQKFLPAGRVQSAIGSPRQTTAFNCFVSMTIPDSMEGIMDALREAAQTMRMGGGIGYDFSTLRPRGAKIKSLDSSSCGAVGFMDVYNALCGTISSAGHRRGAQMGVLRVDHPDIEEFIDAKTNQTQLTNFNISVAVTDKFMEAVKNDELFDLQFEGEVYNTVRATYLWDKIMRATWDYAEPGILFIDKINRKNNLYYCETISATNPCGEQPLPPHGACLLGSINLVKFLKPLPTGVYVFDYDSMVEAIPHIIRAQDNIIDRTIYPLEAQKHEAENKRRMGIGVTGLANTLEALGHPFGSQEALDEAELIFATLRDFCYSASIHLAKEKGAFPLYDAEKFQKSEFVQTLPEHIQEDLRKYGIRNSHLLSFAPTGTISLTADNVSSGIEPVFMVEGRRKIRDFDGERIVDVIDYGKQFLNVDPVTADQLPVEAHVDMLCLASRYSDSAVSKTCNVGDDVDWERFKNVYMRAYEGGASGCTTFRLAGKRFGIMEAKKPESNSSQLEGTKLEPALEGAACTFDPETGKRTCE